MKYDLTGAIKYHGHLYTTEELNLQISEIGSLFDECKISHGEAVAIALDRTPYMIATLFAMLQRGIVFLPIDISLPEDRLIRMFQLASIDKVIIEKNKMSNTKLATLNKIVIDEKLNQKVSQAIDEFEWNPELIMEQSQGVAYVMFTSGSTGFPKAVNVKREGLENFITGVPKVVRFPSNGIIACFTSNTFDIFFLESILALCCGMTVVLADENERNNPRSMCELITKENINIVQLTPSALRMLQMVDVSFQCLTNVKVLLVGGEKFPQQMLQLLQQTYRGKIYNMYGPTETTIWSTIADLTEVASVNIGFPIQDTEVYIVNEEQEIVDDGVEGELCIAGKGVAEGYRNDIETTNKKFAKLLIEGKEVRVYFTGDIGYYSKEGCLVCLGRKDEQVKILGHRIEVEDVEENIKRIPLITQAIVTGYGEDANQLVCFYQSEMELKERELAKQLQEFLPAYMVPTRWIKIKEIIYTASNKVDRNQMRLNYMTALENPVEQSQINPSTEKLDPNDLEILLEIQQCLENSIDLTQIPLEEKMQSLSIDSVEYIKLLVYIEDKFEMEFEDDMLNLSYFQRLSDFVEYIKKNKVES